MQCGEGCEVRRRICSTEEARHQYRHGSAVRISHTISTASLRTYAVQRRVGSTDLSHYQYDGGCAIGISHISADEAMQYMTTKTAHEVVGGCIYLGK